MIQPYRNPEDLLLNQVYTDDFVVAHHIGFLHASRMRHKRGLLNRLLMLGLDYILKRISTEGSYYSSPFQGKYFFVLFMGKKGEREVHYIMRKKTLYASLNLIQTLGVIPEVRMFYPNFAYGKKTRRIHVSKSLWASICERVNTGIPYPQGHLFSTNTKITNREVVAYLCECFPGVEEKKLRRAFNFGLYRIACFMKRDVDVNLYGMHYTDTHFRAFTYKPLRWQAVTKAYQLNEQMKREKKQGVESSYKTQVAHLTKMRQAMKTLKPCQPL